MAATTISMEGAEMNYLPSISDNNSKGDNIPKFLEFFLQGSIHDNALELVKQRLTALCGEPEDLFELETIYVLGDSSNIRGLENRPMTKHNKKSRSQSNRDDSIDSMGNSLQSPYGAPESPRNPMSNMPMTPSGMGGMGPYSVGPPSVGGHFGTGGPPSVASLHQQNQSQHSLSTNHPNFKPIIISTTQQLPQRRERPIQLKYSGNLIEKGDREKMSQKQAQIASNNKLSVLQQVLIRPTCVSSCSDTISNLIKSCWTFTSNCEFICKGHIFCKVHEDFKHNVKFNIKVRVFNIFRYDKSVNGVTDKNGGIKYDRQTSSYLIEVSLVTQNSGNRDLMVLAATALKNFSDQMRPLVNLERVF